MGLVQVSVCRGFCFLMLLFLCKYCFLSRPMTLSRHGTFLAKQLVFTTSPQPTEEPSLQLCSHNTRISNPGYRTSESVVLMSREAPYRCLVFMKHLVVLRHRDAEYDRGDVLEAVDPFLSLGPLPADVEQSGTGVGRGCLSQAFNLTCRVCRYVWN